MHRLTRFVPVLLSIGALNACSNATPAPTQFDSSAVDVNESLSALTGSDGDQTLNAFDDFVKGSQGDASEAADDNDAGVDEHDGKGGPPRGGKLNRLKHGKAPHGRGQGLGMLLWYADLDALKVCQDLRATCATSADPAACKVEVKACVKPVLDAAFKALCDERIAQCDASARNERGCDEIKNACATGDSSAVTTGDKAGQPGDDHVGPGDGAGGAGPGPHDGDHHPMAGGGDVDAAGHDAAAGSSAGE